MPDRPEPVWKLSRFLWRAVPWLVVMALVWQYTLPQNSGLAVWVTKRLHGLLGFPAPYMFCDSHRLFWHATLFPPAIGLILASYWLGWTQRIVRASFGYAAYTLLTAITITIHESPYLPETGFRSILTSTMADANYLTFGVAIWVLAAGPWYLRRTQIESKETHIHHFATRAWRWVGNSWMLRLTTLVLGVSLVVPLFAASGTQQQMGARWRMARALRDVPYYPFPSAAPVEVPPEKRLERDRRTATAIEAIDNAIREDRTDQMPSAALLHLSGHFYLSMKPDDIGLSRRFQKIAGDQIQRANMTRAR